MGTEVATDMALPVALVAPVKVVSGMGEEATAAEALLAPSTASGERAE